MYTAPFFRRILPWLYGLVFIIAAPILVFYTSGYRYNLKKRTVERDGVLIIDGSPEGSNIFVDGINTNKTLPYTFQNVTPGWHTIRIEKKDHTAWEKRLEIRSEQVTFANQIRLWPIATPKKILSENILKLEPDSKNNTLAVVSLKDSILKAGTWNTRSRNPQLTSLGYASSSGNTSIRWNPIDSSFIINGLSPFEPTYWVTAENSTNGDQLPNGLYSWSDNYTLIGSDDNAMTELQIRSNRLSRTELPKNSLFIDQDFSLQTTGTPSVLLLTKHSLQDRVYELPSTDWRLLDRFGSLLIFKEKSSSHWMALDLNLPSPYVGEVYGDYPRWWINPNNANDRRALLINGGEIWSWKPELGGTQLLWRQAEPIKSLIWHPEGGHIIAADEHNIWSLELDERDGREVMPLGSFEHVQDIAILDTILYISGSRDGQEGVWSLDLEE